MDQLPLDLRQMHSFINGVVVESCDEDILTAPLLKETALKIFRYST